MSTFEKEPLNNRDKNFLLMRSIMDYGMGILWCAMGIFLTFAHYFNPRLQFQFDDTSMKVFGVTCIFYGIFRIYRGYKKNYLRER